MDEPFSALDIQTRQLMENELLELWAANRKSVLFITHDLEEAICAVRPRGRAVGRARHASDRRIHDRPAAAARRRRDPHRRRASSSCTSEIWDAHEGRGAEGLSRRRRRRRDG